jgi:uncharacterized protein (DUF2384 family)
MVAKSAEVSAALSTADGALLAKAVSRIASFWNLTNEALGEILGLSGATVSRLRHGQWEFQRGTKPFELAQFLVRLFRSLDSMTGSDDLASRSWLVSLNSELEARPIDLIRTVKGLVAVADYADSYRANV